MRLFPMHYDYQSQLTRPHFHFQFKAHFKNNNLEYHFSLARPLAFGKHFIQLNTQNESEMWVLVISSSVNNCHPDNIL